MNKYLIEHKIRSLAAFDWDLGSSSEEKVIEIDIKKKLFVN